MLPKFKVGQEVIVSTKEIPDKKGTIKYVGKIDNKPDQFIGVELDQPVGKNNGDVEGKTYFKVQKTSDKGKFGVFVKAASVKLVQTKEQKKQIKKPATGTSKPPARTITQQAPSSGKNKLSNELMQQQSNEIQSIRDQLQAALQKIKEYQEMDSVKQIQKLQNRVKQLQELNRVMKLQIEQVRYSSNAGQEQKLKQLDQKLQFFKNQKENGQKEKIELKKKIQMLNAQLQQGIQRQEMLQTLTIKIENLQAKNQKLKSDLQNVNSQLRTAQMFGSTGGTTRSSGQMQQSIAELNQMITFLQSDLAQQKQKNANLEAQMTTNSTKLSQMNKLQRRLKSRQEQLQMTKGQLQTYSDAANFVQKLTLDLITKQQTLQNQAKKLKQYAQQVAKLQSQILQSNDMITLQGQQMQILEQQIQTKLNKQQQQAKHISLLNDQIAKYKQRIRQLTDSNSSLINTVGEQDQTSLFLNSYSPDSFQQKYHAVSKLQSITSGRLLRVQLDQAETIHYSGILVANILQTLPQQFVKNLYPIMVELLLKLSSTNFKLFLLFDNISSVIIQDQTIYSPEQQTLLQFYLLVLEQLPIIYQQLLTLQFSITSAENQEEIQEIVKDSQLRTLVNRVQSFCQQLLERVNAGTIDVDVSLDAFLQPGQQLDIICSKVKKLSKTQQTRKQLCVGTMKCIRSIIGAIQAYRRSSQARQAALVDSLLQGFLKALPQYLNQCCTNPQVRLKDTMKDYLLGIEFICKILTQIQFNDNLQLLNSLYSQNQQIKMLKQTILSTQYHLKQLIHDLDQLVFSNPLSRIHVKLTGKIWQNKLKAMKDHLLQFQNIKKQKQQLELLTSDQRKKILLLEREIKQRQTTKQMHERRIGQLQIRVEQTAFMQGDLKRLNQKLKSLQEANKLMDDELTQQNKKKKQLEDDNKKIKQRFNQLQTELAMKSKSSKRTALSSEDVSSMAIFKSVLNQVGELRNHTTKRKIQELAFSPILCQRQKKKEGNDRRKILQAMVNVKIGQTWTNSILHKPTIQNIKTNGKQINLGSISMRGKKQINVDLTNARMISC